MVPLASSLVTGPESIFSNSNDLFLTGLQTADSSDSLYGSRVVTRCFFAR